MATGDDRAPWLSGIASRAIAAGIFWWLVARTWFDWLTVIFVVGAITSTALTALFVAGWRRDHASSG